MGLEGDWRKRLEELDLSKESFIEEEAAFEDWDSDIEEENRVMEYKGGKFRVDDNHSMSAMYLEKEVFEKFFTQDLADELGVYLIDEDFPAGSEIGKYMLSLFEVEPLDEKAEKVMEESPYSGEEFTLAFWGVSPKIMDFYDFTMTEEQKAFRKTLFSSDPPLTRDATEDEIWDDLKGKRG